MTLLYLRAFWLLQRAERMIRRGDFEGLRGFLRDLPRSPRMGIYSIKQVCRSVDIVCVFYMRRVLCLQRSVATAALLRWCSFRAEVVIAAQPLPFKSHAWVEVDGAIVNDKSYLPTIYGELDRF